MTWQYRHPRGHALDPVRRAPAGSLQPALPFVVALLACALLLGCGNGDGDEDAGAKDAVADSAPVDGNGGEIAGDAVPGTDAAPDTAPPEDTAADGDVAKPTLLTARSLKFDDDLRAVWGSSPSDVWLVGAKGRLLHWNGKTLAPRDAGTSQDLHGVWGRGPDEVYFAGDGVLRRWNGLVVEDGLPADAPKGVYRAVHAPADGSTVLVAGDDGVVLRLLDDGTWKQEQTSSKLQLLGLWAINGGLVWAVGPQGQALKLSGGTWSATAIPKATKTLRVVAGSPTGRLYTAGDGGFLAATTGGVWEATLANDTLSRSLHGLWAVSDTEAWAIGDKGALLHHVGKKWLLEDLVDANYMKQATFFGLWGHEDKAAKTRFALAVGAAGAGLVHDGQKWQDFRAETVADLRAVAAADDGSLYAVGADGLLLRAADAQAAFYDLAAPVTGAALHDVASDGAGGVWAVGAGGLAVQRDAKGAYTIDTVAGAGDLFGLTRLAAGDALAVGDLGFAARRTASGWTAEATGTQIPLRSVAAAGGFAFAVGDFGTVVRRGGDGKWAKEDTGELVDLTRVVAWGDGEAMAVSKDAGTVLLRGAGATGTWQKVFEAPGAILYGAARRPDGTLVAVGYGGRLVVGKPGGAFQELQGGVASILFGVASTAQGTVAVGTKGGVFQVAEKLP